MKKIFVFITALILASCGGNGGGTINPDQFTITVGTPVWVIENGYHAKWSPDDRYIAYTSPLTSGLEIWLWDSQTNTTRSQVSGMEGDMTITWKPDGSVIAFEAYIGQYNHQIWTSNITSGETTKITNYAPQLFAPDWYHNTSIIMVGSQGNFYTMQEDGSGITRIGGSTLTGWSHAVNRTGDRFVFTSDRSGNDDIWAADTDGSNLTQLTFHSSHDGRARWSPDGTKIVFESDRSGTRNVWIYDFITSQVAQVTTTGGHMPDWSNSGNNIVYVNDEDIWTIHVEF